MPEETPSPSFYVPDSAMIIMAHPDDIEFSCAGTIARWTALGTRVCYVLVTSGDVGIATDGMTKSEAVRIREREQQDGSRGHGVAPSVTHRSPRTGTLGHPGMPVKTRDAIG